MNHLQKFLQEDGIGDSGEGKVLLLLAFSPDTVMGFGEITAFCCCEVRFRVIMNKRLLKNYTFVTLSVAKGLRNRIRTRFFTSFRMTIFNISEVSITGFNAEQQLSEMRKAADAIQLLLTA